jgi:hypothetical protein
MTPNETSWIDRNELVVTHGIRWKNYQWKLHTYISKEKVGNYSKIYPYLQ